MNYQILNELTIKIVEQQNDSSNLNDTSNESRTNNKETKEGTVVYTDILAGEEIEKLQQNETKEIKYENLKSNTKYTIEITGDIELGNTKESIPITYNYKEFITLKIPAKVEIKNQFVTGNLIDFDVRIEDINNSVLNNKVRMELRNSSNDLIDLQELTTNEDYIRKTYEKLEENQKYKLSFYADQYNEGSTDSTYKVNYLIKEIEILTEPGISGSIGLTELSKKATGKNLVDISSEIKWYVYPNFNSTDYYGKEYNEETKTLTLGGNSNYRRAVYDLREYAGQEVTMSFKAKAVSGSQTAYIQNSKTDTNRTKIEGLTEEWKDFQYTLKVDSTGYLGFCISGGNGIEVQELQIELGNKKTKYEEFKYILQSNYSINLEDRRDEITTNDYYIKTYEDNNLLKTDRYEEIPAENVITNAIKTYATESGKQYKVELVIKIKDREYVLSELEYNTQDTEEIKGIYNKEDFLELQPKGHYIVLGDIDLRGGIEYQYRFGNTNLQFNGTLNFNGHTLIRDAKTTQAIIYAVGNDGYIYNVVGDIYLNNEIEMQGFMGIIHLNYGTVKNISINLKECNNKPNNGLSLLMESNYNTIENFTINLEKNMYVDGYSGILTCENYGTIKNGYVYGEDIIITNYSTGNKNIGGLIVSNIEGGIVENIYTLNNMRLIEEKGDGTVASIISLHRYNSIVKNCYSVGTNINETSSRGPSIAYVDDGGIVENIYYFYGETKNNAFNTKTTPLALWDNNFQNQILNSDNAFNVDELTNQGYYPQLNMPDCMPAQEYIELPEVADKDLADILSTEVLEQGSNTVKVKFVVNNPSAETITDISIENLKCVIEQQEYSNGQSTVIATLSNPVICTSNYSVQSITTKGALTQEYTRTFNKNERIIPIELYKEIRSIDDWLNINKSPTENYMLMNDLDFMNQGDNIRIIATYTGKFEGNNYTLKNINVKSYLFSTISGKVQNINIENVTLTKAATGNIGFFASTDNANIENIFIKNERIILSSESKITVSAGGVIGYMESTNIQNITVTGLSIEVNDINSSFRIGGLIGYLGDNNMIKNSFVQDLNIKETASLKIEGIGGIAGITNAYNTYKNISNCYVIGNINSTQGNIGGIVGKAESIDIKNCISKVNIVTQANNIAGIAGNITTTAANSKNQIENNLVLGNIYSKNIETKEMNRIIGNGEETKNNYAYDNQLINGEILTDALGAKLISYNEIFTENTYKDVINFNNQYDLTGLKDEILPKLLSTAGKLLPNQLDNRLDKEHNVRVESIEVQKTGANTLEARINLINKDELNINKVMIDGVDVEIIKNSTQDARTYINIQGTVTKYYDNYRIEEIGYIDSSGENKTIPVEGKLEVQFFKELYTFEDWQNIDPSSSQNYRLMADIDFSGKTNIKDNILVNRMETDGSMRTLKNINLEYTSSSNGLIKSIGNSLENIKFENVTIKNATSDSNNIAVIVNSDAEIIQNIAIKNLTINALGNYIAFISSANGETIKQVNIDTVNLTGNARVGALVGYVEVKNIDDIYGTNIQIEAKGNNVGGIIGRIQNVANGHMKNVTIEGNSTIISNGDFIGGVVGYKTGNSSFQLQQIYSRNISVTGKYYVGGVGGTLIDAYNIYVENANVEGEAYVGGIEGEQGSIWSSSIKNSNIKATGNYVGGVAGYANWNLHNIQAINVNVESTGNYVGAIAGIILEKVYAFNIYAVDCSVEGNSYVGGIAGKFTSQPLYKTYNNSKVTATNHSAGGILGYLDNTGMTAVNNTSKLYSNSSVGARVTAKSNVGGFIGDIADDLYMPETYYYSNYIEAYLNCENTDTVSLGIGGRQNQNQYLKDTYYYKYSSINGENPNSQNEVFISTDKYLVEEDLKKQTTYTTKMKWSATDWNFDMLQNNKYPTFKNSSLPTQEGIDIPKDAEHIIGNTKIAENDVNNIDIQNIENKGQPEQIFEYANKQISTYSTGSIVTSPDKTQATRDAKLYVKDNKLYAVPIVLGSTTDGENIIPVADNLILDSYNGKEYETVLGSDGRLYDLKEPIEYPENFVNLDIESIGNNLTSDSHEIEITYKNGDKLKFNYQTGEVISSSTVKNDTDEEKEKIGIIDYVKEKLAGIGNATSDETMSVEQANNYEASKELQAKLEEMPIEEAMEKQDLGNSEQGDNSKNHSENTEDIATTEVNTTQGIEGVASTENNATNNSLKEKKYITIYNEATGEYEIYDEEELLDTSKEEVISENEKIEANNLDEYYASESETKNTKLGIVWIVLSIIGVGIVLFALKKNLRKGK